VTVAADLRAAFAAPEPLTVGLEDELMLLDPDTWELTPRAPELLTRLDGDLRFKLELPASQLEIVTEPTADLAAAIRQLLAARRELAARARGLALPAAAGAHPFSAGEGELNRLARHRGTVARYHPVIGRQLVCALQVHVAVGDAASALAVYNAARGYLPLLAALAANAPFYEGGDSGLASVRPKLCELLPRQGVPPPIATWEQFAADLAWQRGALAEAGAWWWELRPHAAFGTLEFRVPDGQTTVADAAAVAAVAQALVGWLAERHQGGEPLPAAPSWRIAENRWSACRDGVEGAMADLQSGAVRPTREWLNELLEQLEPVAGRLGSSSALAHARELVERNGAIAQRAVAAEVGPCGLAKWLAERFLEAPAG